MVSTTILLALFTSKLPLELPTQASLLLPLLVIERGVAWIIDLISMTKTKGIRSQSQPEIQHNVLYLPLSCFSGQGAVNQMVYRPLFVQLSHKNLCYYPSLPSTCYLVKDFPNFFNSYPYLRTQKHVSIDGVSSFIAAVFQSLHFGPQCFFLCMEPPVQLSKQSNVFALHCLQPKTTFLLRFNHLLPSNPMNSFLSFRGTPQKISIQSIYTIQYSPWKISTLHNIRGNCH